MAADPNYVYGQNQQSRSSIRLFLGLIIVDLNGYKDRKYRIAWGRFFLLLPFFLLALWVLTAETYYFSQKYMSGIATTRRADMYLYYPDTITERFRNFFKSKAQIKIDERAKLASRIDDYGKDAHLRRKGEYYVIIAKAALERQDYAEFAKYIGTGASMTPTNLEAQRMCADLFFAFGRPLDAYQLLEDSLDFAKHNREHFRMYLYRCFMFDQDKRIIDCANKYAKDPGLDGNIRSDLHIAQAQANFLRGDYAETLNLIRLNRLDRTAEGYLLNCQVLWENGDHDAALEILNSALRSFPSANRLLEMKARWLKESGNLDGARDCLDLLSINDPTKFAPVIQSLYLLPGEGLKKKREALIARVIATFSKEEQAMLDLSRYGNDTADPLLTERIMKIAEEQRFPNRIRFTLIHVECLINAGRARETILIVDDLYKRAEREQWVAETLIAFEALRTIAYFNDNQPEIGSINLQKLMLNKNIPPQLLISASRKLIAAQHFDEANSVLVQAHLLNESNQAVLMQIVRFKLANPRISNDLEVYLRRLMSTRRPPQDLLEVALRRLGSDSYLYSLNRTELLKDIEAMLKP
ncbi:MAG: hypothetical protein D4R66_00910 [Opitutales bacterium]|jgi:hypothetical protein|nr:MAG: hypothetical protein D4R66_00910 [Opitutales bacterium]